MSEVQEAEKEWIKNHLIPNISKNVGKPSDNDHWEISFPQNAFYLSYLYFLTVTFEPNKETDEKLSENTLKLVVKKPSKFSIIEAMLNMEQQFHNEILFYTKVATESARYPRCFYSAEGAASETAIVMENITELGYDICTQAFDLPLEYVLSAVEEIGRLHAIAYVMKEQKPEELNRVVNDIREARFLESSWMKEFLDVVATRPIEWLRDNCEPEFCDKLQKHFSNAWREIMIESVKPVEPLATLCHGDFTRNNIFFRKVDGKVEAMLFDFAYMTYASPAIDLSTFLYLNCSTSDRVQKFDDIFHAYHKALITCLRDSGIKNLEKYSYDKFLADYKRRATFGFMISLFFLPLNRGLCVCEFERYYNDLKGAANIVRAAGGEAVTEEFGRMVLELRDTGCLDHLSY